MESAVRYKAQVAIVGGGPVGLGLALELARHNIRSVIIERRGQLHNIPKGQNLTQRTMEHFQFWGVVDQVRAARTMPPDHVIGNVYAYGSLASPWHIATSGREMVNEYYSQPNDRIPQYALERVLRDAVEQCPLITTLYDHQAENLEQDDDGVRVGIKDRTSGETFLIQADYCAGCDGGRSMVGKAAKIERSARIDYKTKMALVVFNSKEFDEQLKSLPDRSTYTVLKPELKGYWQFFGRVDMDGSWFFHAPVPIEADDHFDYPRLLREASGFDFECRIEYVGFWDLSLAVAQSYRNRRAFIAGDAAHTHPPYGGFGVNNGLEDATNLAWKLAAVINGWGGERLLESYGLERQPVFEDTGENFIGASIRDGATFLERYSPERDLDEFEAAWIERYSGDSGRAVEYEPHYEGSPVITGPADARTSARGRHMFKARAGHHLAPQPMADGCSNFEALGRGFSLLHFVGGDATAQRFTAAAERLGIPLTIIGDSSATARRAYEADYVLVRPDQYVAWCGSDAPSDIDGLLLKATGRD